jgi:hypothetical protein
MLQFLPVLKSIKHQIKCQYHAQRQKISARREARLITKQSEYPPILVYQMGKVGSKTVFYSLQKANLPNLVYHFHFLSGDLIRIKQQHIKAGRFPVGYDIELGLAVFRILNKLGENKPNYKIISLVRDPIAWQISNLFQNPDFFPSEIQDESGLIEPIKAVAFLKNRLSQLESYSYVFDWFDKELKSVFNIDVFAYPFNRDHGYSILGDNDVLLLQMESLGNIGSKAISKFLNSSKEINLQLSNVRSQTRESQKYQFVKNQIKLDKTICEKIYSTRFVKHFYNPNMIDKFIHKWS